jgi:hypothetical protein
MSASPPLWSSAELDAARLEAIEVFRDERMREPLEDYLDAFDYYRGVMEELLEATIDLSRIREDAVEVLAHPDRLCAARYLAGPPISEDDLKILTGASLAPGPLRRAPDMARRVVETILLGLDRRRFPWMSEDRDPTDAERADAAMASAALIASRRVMTNRANEGKQGQEALVAAVLREHAGFECVATRNIGTLADAPAPGRFCRESLSAQPRTGSGKRVDAVLGP